MIQFIDNEIRGKQWLLVIMIIEIGWAVYLQG